MERSERLDELGKALAKAQASITDATKSRQGQARGGSYKYATLGDVWDACRGPLSQHGLSVVQYALPSEPGTVLLATMLLHESGQFLTGVESMPIVGEPNPQTYGSAMTYARRYGLAAMLGVVADDDDDGAAASGNRQQGRQQSQQPRSAPPAARPETSGDRPAASQPPPRAEEAVRGGERQGSYSQATGAQTAAPPSTDPAASGLACSRPDCGKPLTKGQHDVSVRAFGQPLCPGCQKQQARPAA